MEARFTRWDVRDVGSVSEIFRELPRTGIYWLRFDNGQEYVGQSRNVVRRYADHRRKQDGTIESIAFMPTEPGDLNLREAEVIEWRDRAGANLRNKKITSIPGGLRTEQVVIHDGEVVRLPWNREQRSRVEPSDRARRCKRESRESQLKAWEHLQGHELWPEIRQFLRVFIRETMSAPDVTAGSLWSLTVYPSTNRSASDWRLVTLTVGNVEAVFIRELADGTILAHWNVWRDVTAADGVDVELPFIADVGHLLDVFWIDHYSRPAWQYVSKDVSIFTELIMNPEMADMSYRFNTACQRQGGVPSRRFHNFLASDDLLRVR